MKKKKSLIITLIVVLLLIVAFAIYFFVIRKGGKADGNGKTIFVQKVGDITGANMTTSSRFMGVVESQETKNVNRDSTKKVKKILVKEGDTVKKGDPLFTYDTSEMKMTLDSMELELQGIQNSINTETTNLNELASQRDKATDEDVRAGLTAQINSSNSMISQYQYNLSVKQLDIERQKKAMNEADVLSPMDGTIKKINAAKASSSDAMSSDMGDMGNGSDDSFITIMADGDLRVKGTVDEQNVYSLSQGIPVILRSRVDSEKTWKGTVTKVGHEPKKQSNNDYGMVMDGSQAERSSQYEFYVSLESSDDLMLGQHLYIELDQGQSIGEGLQLPSYFILQEGDKFYVWKRDEDKRIKKQEITVGEYNEEFGTYEVTGGLTVDDYIAYPDANVAEGNKTTTTMTEENMPQMGDEGMDGMGGMDGMDGIEMMPDGVMMPDGEMASPSEGEMMPEDGMPAGDETETEDGDGVISPDGASMEKPKG